MRLHVQLAALLLAASWRRPGSRLRPRLTAGHLAVVTSRDRADEAG